MSKKLTARQKKEQSGRQCAALPLAVRDGETQVMLVTSRETRRWVLPKGWEEPSSTPHEQAAREAFEEAGLVGKVEREPIGHYSYIKRLRRGRTVRCEVGVFPLWVERPTCCTGRGIGRIEPDLYFQSCDADVLCTTEPKHAVQHVGGDDHFGPLAPVSLRTEAVTNDAFSS